MLKMLWDLLCSLMKLKEKLLTRNPGKIIDISLQAYGSIHEDILSHLLPAISTQKACCLQGEDGCVAEQIELS